MALTLLEKAELRIDADFQARVRESLVVVAGEILAEDPSTEGHESRVAWAYAALQDPHFHLPPLLGIVMQNATIGDVGSSATDADILAATRAAVPLLENE